LRNTAAEVARQTALVTTSSLEKNIRRVERNYLEQESKEKRKLQRDLKDETKVLAGEKSKVMALLQVCALTLIHMHCFIMFISFLCSIMSHQVMKQAQTDHGKEMNIMTQNHVRLQDELEVSQKNLVAQHKKSARLQQDFEAAVAEGENTEDQLKAILEDAEGNRAHLDIREGTKGKPVGFPFVRHCATLLATGGSARSVREQLLLNAGFFLDADELETFRDDIPSLRWFQYQREGMGLESLVYTLIRLAKCERVEQWGFDETSLNGVPTLNQWCRIMEGGELVIVTMECAGLLTGSSSAMVAEHVRVTWERGQHLLELLRVELGDMTDAFVPLTNGGIVLAKLQGVMHDTCSVANAIARRMKVLRDDSGKDLYGVEEWKSMEEYDVGWQDFLCGNHSRNLHFDAYNRDFAAYIKVHENKPSPKPFSLASY
jgi:hypothetical protein